MPRPLQCLLLTTGTVPVLTPAALVVLWFPRCSWDPGGFARVGPAQAWASPSDVSPQLKTPYPAFLPRPSRPESGSTEPADLCEMQGRKHAGSTKLRVASAIDHPGTSSHRLQARPALGGDAGTGQSGPTGAGQAAGVS